MTNLLEQAINTHDGERTLGGKNSPEVGARHER